MATEYKAQNPPVVLREHQYSGPFPLTISERKVLRELVPEVALIEGGDAGGMFQINPGNAVGAVQIGDRRFELRPKMDIDRLFFLLSYSMNPKHWKESSFRFEHREDIFEAVVQGFAYQLEMALRQGQLSGYTEMEEAIQTVRGRIRFNDHIRDRHGLIPPIECRFDEFTQDIELNRQIKSAIVRLGRIRVRDEDTRRRIRVLEAAFSNVSYMSYDPARLLPEVSFNKLNEHFRPSLEFARLILQSRSLGARSGGVYGEAFLLDLSEVFENFVVKSLRESLGLSDRSFPQQCRGRNLYLDHSQELKLRPDISWWDGGSCVFVGDVKYKRTSPAGRALHPDMYQLLAYMTATDLPSGTLIYAKGEAPQKIYGLLGTNKSVEVRTMDLSVKPALVLEQVQQIGETIVASRSDLLGAEK